VAQSGLGLVAEGPPDLSDAQCRGEPDRDRGRALWPAALGAQGHLRDVSKPRRAPPMLALAADATVRQRHLQV